METLIEQYKKDQGNLPCKLAIACARPLSEAEVKYVNITIWECAPHVIVLIRSKRLGSMTCRKIYDRYD